LIGRQRAAGHSGGILSDVVFVFRVAAEHTADVHDRDVISDVIAVT